MRIFFILQRALAGVGVGLVLVALPVVALADTANTSVEYPTSNTSVTPTGNTISVQNPLGNTTSLCGLMLKFFQGAVAIGIPVAVVFIIWSGFQFVLAQGNTTKLQKARRNFFFTVIGIAVFLGAGLLATVIASTVNAIGGSNIISCK